MNESFISIWLLFTFAGGVVLGVIFFGGLWLTLRCYSRSAFSPLLFPVSFLFRTALVVVGMYWFTSGDWRAVLLCMTGFLLTRSLVIRSVLATAPVNSSAAGMPSS